jgi:hypothetical protein
MTGLGHEGQVGRESTTVCAASSLLIGVWGRHVIRELSRTLEHLSLVARAVLVLNFLGHSTRLIGGVGDTDKVTPSNTIEGVAGRADFTVDLVATADAVAEFSQGMKMDGWMTHTCCGQTSRASHCETKVNEWDGDPLHPDRWRGPLRRMAGCRTGGCTKRLTRPLQLRTQQWLRASSQPSNSHKRQLSSHINTMTHLERAPRSIRRRETSLFNRWYTRLHKPFQHNATYARCACARQRRRASRSNCTLQCPPSEHFDVCQRVAEM